MWVQSCVKGGKNSFTRDHPLTDAHVDVRIGGDQNVHTRPELDHSESLSRSDIFLKSKITNDSPRNEASDLPHEDFHLPVLDPDHGALVFLRGFFIKGNKIFTSYILEKSHATRDGYPVDMDVKGRKKNANLLCRSTEEHLFYYIMKRDDFSVSRRQDEMLAQRNCSRRITKEVENEKKKKGSKDKKNSPHNPAFDQTERDHEQCGRKTHRTQND
jgi:hypothetical protein